MNFGSLMPPMVRVRNRVSPRLLARAGVSLSMWIPESRFSERLSRDAFLVRLEEGAVEANAAKVSDEVVTREAEQNYWWYALLVMLVLLVAEAWLGRTMA